MQYPALPFLANFGQAMKPHRPAAKTSDMFRPRLDEQLNMKHPLIRLTGLMDWELIEHHFAGHFR
jgi:IS5 family transposase